VICTAVLNMGARKYTETSFIYYGPTAKTPRLTDITQLTQLQTSLQNLCQQAKMSRLWIILIFGYRERFGGLP
jgi:hypothetical protein